MYGSRKPLMAVLGQTTRLFDIVFYHAGDRAQAGLQRLLRGQAASAILVLMR